MIERLRIAVGDEGFTGRLEHRNAPATCAAFVEALPFLSETIHVRWSGEAVWMPLGDLDFGVGYENATSYPSPGQMILYPGGVSETEILLAYGNVRFASKAGQLAGNHFLTIVEGEERLRNLGRVILYRGARPIRFEAM